MNIEKNGYLQVKETTIPIYTVWLVLFLLLNGVMMSVGIVKWGDCSIQPKIPIYLVVAGSVGIVSKLLPFINRKFHWPFVDLLVSITYLCDFIWVILGSVWIYGIFKPNFDPAKGLYCDEVVYIAGFSLLTLHWIFLAIFLVVGLTGCAFSNSVTK